MYVYIIIYYIGFVNEVHCDSGVLCINLNGKNKQQTSQVFNSILKHNQYKINETKTIESFKGWY